MIMVEAQVLVAIKMNSSIDSTNVLVANLKPLYWALWPRWLAGFAPLNYHGHGQPWTAVSCSRTPGLTPERASCLR